MKKRKILHFFYKTYQIYKDLSARLKEASISAYAGQSAFMLILSFFPFIILLTSLLKFTSLSEEVLIASADIAIPSSFEDIIIPLINEVYQGPSHAVLSITIITALWLGSKTFLALIRGLNSVYGLEENRNYFVVRFLSILYTFAFALLLVLVLAVLVFGNTLYLHLQQHFPFLENILLPIISFRTVIGFIIMLFFFNILYTHVPNKKLHFSEQLPGALLATSGWLGFSYLYSYYVDHISNYSSFYGTMTTIALLMVWLYACMYILFLGGFLNCLLNPDRCTKKSAPS